MKRFVVSFEKDVLLNIWYPTVIDSIQTIIISSDTDMSLLEYPLRLLYLAIKKSPQKLVLHSNFWGPVPNRA